MNYIKIYDNFIKQKICMKRAKNEGTYFELHHIVPKSFGGDNSKENLVLLTLREHIFAHLLLFFSYKNDSAKKHKMLMSLNVIICGDCHKKCSLFLNKKEIFALELVKKNINNSMVGENNPFFGKKHSLETKKILSEKQKQRNISGKNNPNYGNKWNEQQKLNLSIKLKQWRKNHPEFDPKDVSEEIRDKIRKTKIGVNNPNSKICKLVFADGREEIVQSPLYENMKKIGVSYQSFRNCFISKNVSINKNGVKLIILFSKGREKENDGYSR